MANRYWVGGTADWNGTAGTKWATTSGGAGGASVPTSADDVFFDANSGSGVVTLDSNGSCLNLNFTGFTGTFTGVFNLDVYGDLTLAASMTFSFTGPVYFRSTSTGRNITCAGKTLGTVYFDGSGGGWTMQDTFASNNNVTLTEGNLNMNGQVFSCTNFISFESSTARTLTLGAANITVNTWSVIGTGMTFSGASSTINTVSAFTGGGRSYGTVNITSSGTATVSGSNTFDVLSVPAGKTVRFAAGSTQTVTTLTANGSVGNSITLESTSSGNTWSISKSSGTVVSQYVSLKDSIATGGATWFAVNSTDAGNNTGWSFVSADLDPSTTYYVRAFAQNSAGYSYGDQESFTTLSGYNPAIARRRLLTRR